MVSLFTSCSMTTLWANAIFPENVRTNAQVAINTFLIISLVFLELLLCSTRAQYKGDLILILIF